MVIMTLAMTSTSSGPVLALGGSSMANMPGMEHMASTPGTDRMASMEAMEARHGTDSMEGMTAMPGMDMPGMANTAADAGSVTGSSSMWRFVVAALAVYFLLSIGASVWARARGTNRNSRGTGSRPGWEHWLLAMPDTVFVFLASLTISVWDKNKMARHQSLGRRRKLGAAPDAALAAHVGMGGTMFTMLLMMAA
jgi:hypothetical protein